MSSPFDIGVLSDLLIIFLLAIAVLIVTYRFKIPSVVGFLLTGIILGPGGLSLITDSTSIAFFAEIGIIFLLFTIGLEFSFEHLLKSSRFVILGGALQVFSTIILASGIAIVLGADYTTAVFVGMLLSLSSTAIVMRLLQEHGEVDSPHGRASLGILIFQDLIIIPMMLILPVLAGNTDNQTPSLLIMFIGGCVIIVLVYVLSRYIIPALLTYAANLKSREMFIFIVVGTCLAITYLTNAIGLSLALGAFLAGLIISESEYSTHAMYNVLPFRDIFTSFFFISVGMLFSTGYLLAHPAEVILLTIGAIGIKIITGTLATVLLGLAPRASVITGFSLAQIGEFSFILATTGLAAGLLMEKEFNTFMTVSICTMAVTPLMILLSHRVAPVVAPWLSCLVRIDKTSEKMVHEDPDLCNHIIIVGFGLSGHHIARTAKAAGIPYIILETNPETVRRENERGQPIIFGDAGQTEVLVKAGADCARVLVIVINDPYAIQQIIQVARDLNEGLYIIVRTRYTLEVKSLLEFGADEVIAEEFETSVEIFSRILQKYLLPADDIDDMVNDIRADGYQMLRSLQTQDITFDDLRRHIPNVNIESIRIGSNSEYVGKTLIDMNIRSRFGVSVVAIKKGIHTKLNPGGDLVLDDGDILVVIGYPKQIRKAFKKI